MAFALVFAKAAAERSARGGGACARTARSTAHSARTSWRGVRVCSDRGEDIGGIGVREHFNVAIDEVRCGLHGVVPRKLCEHARHFVAVISGRTARRESGRSEHDRVLTDFIHLWRDMALFSIWLIVKDPTAHINKRITLETISTKPAHPAPAQHVGSPYSLQWHLSTAF